MAFTRIQIPEDSPLWDILIIASSVIVGCIIILTLSAGYESVYPHLLDIPIILYAYRYPRRGIWFAALVSAVYLIAYGVILSPSLAGVSPAVGRVLIFLVIGTTVSLLSYRLRNSENTYRNLFDNLSDAAYSVRIHPDRTLGPFMDVNEMMCAMVGYRREDLLGMTPADVLPEAYIQELQARVEGQHRDVYGSFESFHIAGDNTHIPVEVRVHLFETEAGPIILATATDVTERYHRARILRAQRDVAVSLSDVKDSGDAVRQVIGFALEISGIDAGAFYQAEDDGVTFSSQYSVGFSPVFLQKNYRIRLLPEEAGADRRGRPVYGSAEDLVRAGMINGTGENQKVIGILPVRGSRGIPGLFLLSSYGTSAIPDTERRLIEALVAQTGAALDRLRVVQALRQSREDLRSLVDSLDGYQALAAPDGTIITANRSFAVASGMDPEDVRGKNILEFTHRSAEFKSFLRDSFADVLLNRRPVRFEDEGGEYSYDTILYPVPAPDGSVRAVGMLSTDISALKEAEGALLETERRYRLVIEALNIGVFDLHYPRQTMTVSPEWYAMLGYDGDMPENVYDFWLSHLHPDETDGVIQRIEEIRYPKDDYYNEYRMRTSEGTWRWIKSHGRVIRWNADGSVSQIIGTHSDITRRKRAERAFERTNRLLRDAQTVARLGYYEYDVANDLILPDAGLYEILNITDEEPVFTFHEFCGFIHPDDRAEVQQKMMAAAEEHRSLGNVFRISGRGGFEIWVRAWMEPFVAEDGEISSVFGAVQDITDVRRAEEELLRTQIAVETSPDEVLYIAPNGEILYGNQQAVNTYGKDGAITGFMIGDIDPRFAPEAWHRHWGDLRTNTYLIHESRHRTSDGTLFPVEVVENYVKVGNREFSCAYCRNITKRRRAEDALRESEQRFSLAVAGADMGIWDWDIASDSVVYDARFGSILGISPEDQAIRTFRDLMATAHPNDRNDIQHALDAYIARRDLPFLAEFRVSHRDGTWRWVRGRALIVSEDAEGMPLRMIGTIMDTTESHEAMDALAEQGEQLRETQEMARVGGWVHQIPRDRLDFDRRILPILGYDGAKIPETMGAFFREFVHPEDRASVEEAYGLHLTEYRPFDMVYRIVLPKGRVCFLHSRCQTFYDNAGVPQKSVGIIQDVTGLKEAEHELLEREWKVNEAQRVTHIRFWECDRETVSVSGLWRDGAQGGLSFLEREGLHIHPDDYARLALKFCESVETQAEFSEEFRAVQEDSEAVLHIFCRGSHYYHTDGSYLRSLGTLVDITQRVQTMTALRESEHKFRLVAENPSIGTYIVQDGRFVYVNDTCARFFGNLIEEMIGMPATEIIAPEIRSEIADTFAGCITGAGNDVHLEIQGYTRTGVTFPIEIFGSVGEYGGREAVIGTIIDITERKAYEEMLSITRFTVDQATIGIGWVTRAGEVIYVNARGVEMLRIPAETLLGMTIWEIHPSLDTERWAAFWDGLCSGGNRRFETVQVRGDATSFPANVMVDYVLLGDMEFACIFVTDISRRREAEDALHQSLAEKTTLLQEVHHRVKNNLALISSMIQMQMRTLEDEQAVSSLTETANRILSMALVHESIYRSRNITTIDAHEHLTALVHEIVPNLSAGKRIGVAVEAHGCTLDLNSGILYSLIVNELITNSIKYAFYGRDTGMITITMECGDDGKVLRVSDDGVGIPETTDPFRRPSLGMNIVHSVVTDQLGGTIELVRGEGTTWVLTFPGTGT